MAFAAVLAPLGLPALAIGMVVTVWLLVLGAQTFDRLRVVPLAEVGPAEQWLPGRRMESVDS